jgi:DNA-binding NtrC family response regulator
LVQSNMLSVRVIVRGGRRPLSLPTEKEAAIDKAQILVIDDESSVADALRLILEDSGYEVTVAATARAGLELVRRRRFAVVVSDVRLPDATGLEVLAAVRREWPHGGVILITAQRTSGLLAEARSGGAFAVLHKPFCPKDVLRLVAAALGKK